MSGLSNFFFGKPGQFDQRSNLGPNQQPLLNQLTGAAQNYNAFTDPAQYYSNLLSNNPADLQAMAAPEIRRFNQKTIPGLAEEFAGLGSGALSSSGFRNAAVNAGTDLMERIANLRAGLRQQGAQGLQNLGQQGLGSYYTNTYQPRTPGLLESLAPALGQLGGAMGGSYLQSRLLKDLLAGLQSNRSSSGVQE